MTNQTIHFYGTTPVVARADVLTEDSLEPGPGIEQGLGIYSDGDLEVVPLIALSEQSAYELGIALIAQAASTDKGLVRMALRSKGL